MKRPRHALAKRVLLVLAGIFLLTYLSVAATVFYSIRGHLTESIQANLTQTASDSLERLQAEFARQMVDVQAWASLEVMNDLITGDIDERVRRTLEDLKQQYKLPGEIRAFDDKGNLIASSRAEDAPNGIGLPPAWGPRGDGAYFVDKHISPLGEGQIIAFVRPVHASFNRSLRIGTLVIVYPWSAVSATLQNRAAPLAILSAAGNAVLYGDPSLSIGSLDELTASLAVPSQDVTWHGQSYLVGTAHADGGLVPGLNWTVLALAPRQQALDPIRQAAVQMLLLGAAISPPITLLILWLTRRLVQPIASLTRTVAEITASADLSKRVEVASGDELGVLGEAFNAMTAKLQASLEALATLNRTLEQKVADRTQALQSANRELRKAIEQLKSAQSQLVQQEKMASLGQLVAGVAHELNNPIGSIYANLPVLDDYVHELVDFVRFVKQLDLGDDQRRGIAVQLEAMDFDVISHDAAMLVASAKNAANRIKNIVSSLRNFSRLDEAELKDVLLEDGLESTLALLHHQTKNRIEVIRDYRLRQPVACFAGQINQVFMNLLANAVQAIDGSGTITVSTAQEDGQAVVKICDSGRGIPLENLSRIFDPFFTTKPVGEGTGLGLSISYGIVENHHGTITVDSTPGRGSCFTLNLPCKSA